MIGSRARTAGGIALIVVLAVVAGLLGYLETRAARTPTTARTSPTPANTALAGATQSPGSGPTPAGLAPSAAGVARVIGSALSAAALGPRVHAEVRDVASGRVLLSRGKSVPAAPASTAKLLTAAAVLRVRGPAYRIRTRVLAGPDGTLVLVGGGDPTLSGAAKNSAPLYPQAARLSALAAAVRRRHLSVRRIVVDDSAFAGPSVSPAWAAEDVPSSYGAAITGVLTDGGRAAPGDVIRSAAPDLAAGREFATALGTPRTPVTRGRAAASDRVVATVRSAPLSVLVAQMLQQSDNVIADCLARQVALATGRPVTFTGAAAAIRAVVGKLGVQVGGGMLDGSGLADRDRLTVDALAALLRQVAVDGDSSGADGQLGAVLSGLPVAAWSGTLDDRFVSGSARTGAGVIRAKTGTLTGVAALAGLVHDRSGRLLAFAVIADRTGSTPAAEAALDSAVARLARCGCS